MPTNAPPAAHRGQVWLGLLVLYFVWGSTYLGIAYAVETIPPFLMAAIRFALAGLVLLTWSIARSRGEFVPPSRREWRDSAIVGAMLLGGGMGMVAWGEQTIPSGIAALVIGLMPVWVAVLGRGYSITSRDGHVLKKASDVKPGDALDTRLGEGSIRSRVLGP